MGTVKIKPVAKLKLPQKNLISILRDIRNVISMYQIPFELIVYFDRTEISYVLASSYTMEKEGLK